MAGRKPVIRAGFARSDHGQLLYNVCREHGLTLEEYSTLHPAEQQFLEAGYAEYLNRTNEDVEST